MYKKTTMNTFTDQQIIDEMLKRFIVPQWYTREDIEDKCEGFSKDQVEHIVETVKYRVYQDVDQTVDEYIENYKEEQDKVAFVCKCGKSIIRDSEEHDICGTIDDTKWFCSECFEVKLKEEEEEEEDHLNCCICEKNFPVDDHLQWEEFEYICMPCVKKEGLGNKRDVCQECYSRKHCNCEDQVEAGKCEDCGNECEDLDDKLCHNCYHASVPSGECWCGE